MAERASAMSNPLGQRDIVLVTWTGLLNGDTGSAVGLANFADKTMQVTGTFGSGGSVTMQGSNDGTNWFTLVDPQGNALTKTSAAGELILENPVYIRPNVTAGDGTTSLAVTVACRRNS